MAKMGAADQFANIAAINTTESAANTLTFKKLETGISLFEKVAWVIHRIEYFYALGTGYFNAAGDILHFGLAATNQISNPTLDNPAVLDFEKITRQDFGAAANALYEWQPLVKDLTNLPGGGLIVPPNPIYGWVLGSGLLLAETVNLRFYYTNVQLSPDQYWELVESRRIISS